VHNPIVETSKGLSVMMRTSMLPSSVLRRGMLACAALTTTLVLSACGGTSSSSDQGGMTMAPSSAPASMATFNDADVTFAQSMIGHHRQAIEMASLADGRAAGAAVKNLAAKIKAGQQPEINTMNGWLTAWGKPMPMPGMSTDSGMSGMDSSAMPGLMSDSDMKTLAGATGAAFDKQFLTMMISHHEGAVTMAEQEATAGSNLDATALAQKIITDQRAEITTMKGLLAQQ
jgi:uncharacterized protein (DUF305 family)